MTAPVKALRYKLPFRSKLLEWLKACPQQSAPIEQWEGMINNLKGIRKEEIEIADLAQNRVLNDLVKLAKSINSARIEDPPTKISKRELIEGVAEDLAKCSPTIQSYWRHSYRPTLDVQTVHDRLPKRIEPRAVPFVERAQTYYQHPSLGFWIIKSGYEDLMTTAPNWIILDPQGKLVLSHARHHGWFPTAVEAFDEMHRVISNRYGSYGKENPVTLFDQYTFLGGNNYQEWFVCLPEWPLPYCDNHFEVDQLLIHIRTTERMDYDGRSLLMIEEIQSPWHADIKRYGAYKDEEELEEDDSLIAHAPFAKEWHELAIKATIWLAIKHGHERIGFTTGSQQCQRWGDLEGLMHLYDSDIPHDLQKVASKYDCAYDWTTIVTRRPEGHIAYQQKQGWVVQDANNKPLTDPLSNKHIALHYLSQRSVPVKEQIRLLQVSSTLKHAMNANEIALFGW